jgi:nucleoside-diphosphate-sugar epimerase
VKDLASILVSSLTSNLTNKNYIVSDGKTYNRYALANLSKAILRKKTLKFHLPIAGVAVIASVMDKLYAGSTKTPALNREKMLELTAINWACSIDQLKRDLAFVPHYDLESGLRETLLWYKQNNWLS